MSNPRYPFLVAAAVEEAEYSELKRRSAAEDRSIGSILRAAIKLYIRRHPRTTNAQAPDAPVTR